MKKLACSLSESRKEWQPIWPRHSYFYNGLDTRVGVTDSLGSRSFKRNGIGVTAPVLSDGLAHYTPSGEVRSGVKTTFHSAVKNTDIQTSSLGAVASSRIYDAFGNDLSVSGSWKSPFTYAGQFGYQQDADTGLKLLGHRYYDSDTGRFLTRDPIMDGRNWYTYCGNDPLSYVDPEGLWRRVACALLGGVAGFIITGGNPLGAAAGAAIGGALGSAADQLEQNGEINWGHAARDGAVDGALSYVGGAIAAKLVRLALPLQFAEDGTVTFVHYTSRKGAEGIAKTKVIYPSGPGLGSPGGRVFGLPKPMPRYVKVMGAKAEEAVVAQVPASSVTQTGLGHLLHKGPIFLE